MFSADANDVGCVFAKAPKGPPLPLDVVPDPDAAALLLFAAAAAAANGDELLPANALNAPVAGLIIEDVWPNADWPKADVAGAVVAGVVVCPNTDCPKAGWPKADVGAVVFAAGDADVGPNADCPNAGWPNADWPKAEGVVVDVLPKADVVAGAGVPKTEVTGLAGRPKGPVVAGAPKAEGVLVEAPNALDEPKADAVEVFPKADVVGGLNADPLANPAGSGAVLVSEVCFAMS